MKIKTMTLTVSRKLSDDNYGSFGADFTLEAELDKGDDVKECRAKLRAMVTREVKTALDHAKEELAGGSSSKKKK